jgi:putative membrane protein
MNWKKKITCVALASLCLGIGITFAQTNGMQEPFRDRQFLQNASISSAWKIALGEIALRQAASKNIKEFSKIMMTDQGQIYNDLKGLAQRKGVTLSEDIDPVHRNTIAFLSQEYGAAFDRNYISLMIDEHQRDAVLYREEAEKGLDADVRDFAGSIVRKLEEYAGLAKKILLDIPKPMLK